MTSNFLSALDKENSGPIPVWFMRQAGRYLPEYQALRRQHDFRTMSHSPNLIKQTTLTPFARLNLDAAILFSDILTCLEFMGSRFHFSESGPVLEDHGAHVLERLTRLKPEQDLSFVGEGIRLSKLALGNTPLIGFAGAPFTLVSYLVEGGTSREFAETRRMVFEHPEKFKQTLDLLADSIADYLLYQISCGADVIQIFDSWVGILSVETYRELVLPSMQRLIARVKESGKPVILYSQPTAHLLPELIRLQTTAVSIDWRSPLRETIRQIKSLTKDLPVIQGNLDPIATTLDWEHARPHVASILKDVHDCGIRKQFIFNVGHGVVPETKWQTLSEIIKFVHEN